MIASDDFTRFARAIEHRLGLRVESDRAFATAELIARRAAAHREPIANYLDRLDADQAELRALASELTVGETYFFRHVEQFNAFADVALPERMAARERVNVLSAGCASGEEPYTLAMLVRERVADPGRIGIHAIDVNPAALERAARGRYSRWALRATPSELESRWFEVDGRGIIVSPAIRAAVAFEERNLVDDGVLWTSDRWDVVFCRNVVMYFTELRAKEVIARIIYSLAPGGFLFLGHAETLRGRSDELELCHTHGTFYYQRKPVTHVRGPVVPAATAQHEPIATDSNWFAEIQAATERIHAMVDTALYPGTSATASALRPLDHVRELLGDERFVEALACLDELPAALAIDRDAVLLRALVFAHTGRLLEAEAACRGMLESGELAGAHYVLALCRESAGDPDGAAYHAQRASALDPSFAMARLHLGLLARRAGDRMLAALELARAIVLLERESHERVQLYGGGFKRQALVELCRAELAKAAS
ncbi:MAG: Protein-glutamate O-methyltransferase [Myxococcales bacterium]|nr:Protein-glutamate O-methyltransferase [Myxococcales bacterium]